MRTITNKYGNTDLRAMLIKAGAGEYNAQLSTLYMNFLPTTTEPYAQGVSQIVMGLQRLLRQRGAKINVDGGLGENTVKALIVYAGPIWYEKTWAQLYGDVIDGRKWESWDRESRSEQKAELDYYNAQKRTAIARGMEGLGATVFTTTQVSGLGHTAYHHLGDQVPIVTGKYEYCSPGHVRAGCTPIAGIAYPLVTDALVLFTFLQKRINALLAYKGRSLIGVDGRIGRQTLEALSWLYANTGVRFGGAIDAQAARGNIDVELVAANAYEVASVLEQVRLATDIPLVADPPTQAPSQIGPGGTVLNPSLDAMRDANGGGFEKYLPYAAAGVGLLLLLKVGGKKKRRSR